MLAINVVRSERIHIIKSINNLNYSQERERER